MRTIILFISLIFSHLSYGQKNIEHEVYSFVLEIKDKYKTNDPLIDSLGNVTKAEEQTWESFEKSIKSAEDLKSLHFKGLTFVEQKVDKKYILTTWSDCTNLLVLEIRKKKKGKTLQCQLIKQTIGSVSRPELTNCK